METNKIAELLEIIERILSAIKDESTERTNKMLFGWQILSHLTQIYSIVNSSNVRAPGQLLVSRLILKECNRIMVETEKSISDIPDEFKLMMKSIKSTGNDHDIEKTQ